MNRYLFVGLLLFPVTAGAQDVDLPLELSAKSAVVAGKGRPCLQIKATAAVRKVRVVIARQGKRRAYGVSRMRSGQKRKFCWREKPGMYEYAVGMSALYKGTQRTKELTVSINYLPPIKLVLDRAKTDVQKRKLVVLLNHPADHAELVIVARGGKVLAREKTEFAAADPGTPLEISWSKLEADIARMDLKVYDTDGFWVGTSISPWTVHIPHAEVAFATTAQLICSTRRWPSSSTKARISTAISSASAKLDAAVKLINKALRDHASKLRVRLYVAGFTDTVGGTSHNRTLSANRARSIARYFKKHGVKISILYRGYGEEALAKKTPDNTDEPKNRRALYILSSQPPRLSKHVTWGGWRSAQ